MNTIMARHGIAGSGETRSGKAGQVIARHGWVRPGGTGRGGLRLGIVTAELVPASARLGAAWLGHTTSAASPDMACHGAAPHRMSGHGEVSLVRAEPVKARSVRARHGMAPSVPAGLGLSSRGRSWLGPQCSTAPEAQSPRRRLGAPYAPQGA